jgi:integrase
MPRKAQPPEQAAQHNRSYSTQRNRLTALAVSRITAPGRYPDGGGLYFQVTPAGRSWVFRFRSPETGKPTTAGLGAYPDVSLERARKYAGERRGLVADGTDPVAKRRADRREREQAAERARTFQQCAEEYIESQRAGWKNKKHAAQWAATLTTYAYPKIGAVSVAEVGKAEVLKVLKPIWKKRAETATRVRGRMESILAYAMTSGYRPEGLNPARWKGNLSVLLPKRSKVAPVQHHRALPYKEMGEFMSKLRAQEGVAPRTLEFIILTASRTMEVLEMRWEEVNGEVWTVPAARMKAGREHVVPLSAAARRVINVQRDAREALPVAERSELVFPSRDPRKALSNMACAAVLDRMGIKQSATVHGFRSTFRDWAGEVSNFPHDVCEMALAHSLSNSTEAAYRRATALPKRVKLMEAWADYCARPATTANVKAIRAA